MPTSTDYPPTLFVVEDDPQMRSLIGNLAASAEIPVEPFHSAGDFLAGAQTDVTGCLVSDVRLPGMDGLELLETLRREQVTLPVILITGHADVPMAVQAMKGQALDFIEKPFRGEDLLERIRRAFEISQSRRAAKVEQTSARERLSRLTPREREIMALVVDGAANKQMAYRLKLSIKTIEAHRGRMMKRLKVASVADLVRLAVAGGVIGDAARGEPCV